MFWKSHFRAHAVLLPWLWPPPRCAGGSNIFIYTCIYAYTYISTYMYIYIYIYIDIRSLTRVRSLNRVCSPIHVCSQARSLTYFCVRTRTRYCVLSRSCSFSLDLSPPFACLSPTRARSPIHVRTLDRVLSFSLSL